IKLAALDRVVERQLVPGELGHVVGGEEHLAAVERVQVTLEDVLRQRVVQRLRPVRVAAVGQQPVHQLGGGGLVGGGPRRYRIRARARKQRQRRGQGNDQQAVGKLHGCSRVPGGRAL